MKKFLKKNHKILYVVIVLTAVVIAALYLFWPRAAAFEQSFGECLDAKKVVMYGSDTCGACKTQKQILGDEFVHVNYVNCQFNLKECTEVGIEKYPTWNVNGQHFVGVQSQEALSELSGCKL